MPGIFKVQHQGNNPAPQNIPTVDAQTANAWWDNLCTLSLTTPKGPARDLTNPSGLSHLLVINDAENNDFYLSAVNMNPAFAAMHGCTYRQLDGILNNSAGMFKMCSNALQGPENKPQVQSNESQLEMNAPSRITSQRLSDGSLKKHIETKRGQS